MPKPILRQSERDAIFREPSHTEAEREQAEGAAAWEHNHPGHHVLKPKPKSPASMPDYTYAKHHYPSKWEELTHDDKDLPAYAVSDSSDWLAAHGDEEEPPEPAHHQAAAVTPRYLILPHWDPEQVVDIIGDHAADMGGHGHPGPRDPHRTAAPLVTPELMERARHGGFTLHDHIGDAPTSGYMVSRHKSTEDRLPLSELTPQHVSNYVNAHTRELADPHTYLGGWLDGKDFYLDISTHRPTIDRAAHDAAIAAQKAIYNLGTGTSINTPDAVRQAGDPGLALPGRPKNPLTSARTPQEQQVKFQQFLDSLPVHDWTQHGLGDAEHWEQANTFRQIDAVNEPPVGPTFDPAQVQEYGDAPGSTHGAKIYRNPSTKENWLVKPDPTGGMLSEVDVAANHLAAASGVDTPPTFKTTLSGKPASAQLMYEGAKDAFPSGAVNPDKLSDEDLLTVQKHHALDWLLSNHDSHERQFIRTPDGKLVGIDKGQAFKYFNNDRLHWNFHPNVKYNEHEPVYNTLYRSMAQGGRQLLDPRDGELGKYVQGLQSMPDEEFQNTLRPYAEAAAGSGMLATNFHKQFPGTTPPRIKPNDVEGFLGEATKRKNSLSADMGDLYDRAMAHRMTGEKIAALVAPLSTRVGVAPDPAALKSMHQQLGSHGARVFADPQGQWLVKRPPPGAEFMVPLDNATAHLQNRVGLAGPETHTLNWKDGSEVTAVKMLDGASQAFHRPPRLHQIHPADLMALQKHQALDWLISNHDGHVGNFMRTPDGALVGIDKGQAAKYYGRDRLDYNFHPNFYAREPVYNQLWRDFAHGRPGEMDDPRAKHSELGQFVQRMQEIPDSDLKNIFRPYAHAAAEAGLLANPMDTPDGQVHPQRGLGEPTIAPNDPEAFLEAMAKRKNNLATDLGTLYDRASAQRAHALAATSRKTPNQSAETGMETPAPAGMGMA